MPPISGHGAPAVVNIKFSDGNLETQKAWSSYLQSFAYFGGRAVYLDSPNLAQLSTPVIGERPPRHSISLHRSDAGSGDHRHAWLVYQKFALLTPLDRLRRDLAERGVPIAMSTLVTMIERAADRLDPVDAPHWRTLLEGSWMAHDGTGLKVLVQNVPVAQKRYTDPFGHRCDRAVQS